MQKEHLIWQAMTNNGHRLVNTTTGQIIAYVMYNRELDEWTANNTPFITAKQAKDYLMKLHTGKW